MTTDKVEILDVEEVGYLWHITSIFVVIYIDLNCCHGFATLYYSGPQAL